MTTIAEVDADAAFGTLAERFTVRDGRIVHSTLRFDRLAFEQARAAAG